jgi:hypothetical protein
MSDSQTHEPSREQLLEAGRRAAKRLSEEAYTSIDAALQRAGTLELAEIVEALERFEREGLCPGFPVIGRAN